MLKVRESAVEVRVKGRDYVFPKDIMWNRFKDTLNGILVEAIMVNGNTLVSYNSVSNDIIVIDDDETYEEKLKWID